MVSLPAQVGFADAGVLREIGGHALGDDPTLLEHVGARSDGEGLRDILLDQQHGHAVGVDRRHHLEHVIGNGRAIKARPIATICCWPPESEPAACRRRSRRIENSA